MQADKLKEYTYSSMYRNPTLVPGFSLWLFLMWHNFLSVSHTYIHHCKRKTTQLITEWAINLVSGPIELVSIYYEENILV